MNSPTDPTLEAIATAAKDAGDGQFVVRVTARRSGIAIPTLLVAFKDASLEHVVNAESWVARLLGGGEYGLTVSHNIAPAKRYGPVVVNVAGVPYPVMNMAAVSSPDWTGPVNVTYSILEQQQQAFAQPVPVAGSPMLNQPMQRPAQPVPPVAVMQAGPSVAQQVPVTGAMAQVTAGMNASDTEKLMLIQREETRIRAELSAKEAELRQREVEARMAREASERDEKMRREMQAQMASMKPPEKTGPDTMQLITGLSAALAPLIGAMIQSGNEARKAQMEMQQRQAELQLAAQQRQAEMMQALMLRMSEKPNGSPELTAMLEMSKAQSEAQGAMMSRIVEAMGVVSKTSVAMIETVAEFSAPPEGSPILDAVKEGTKALMALSQGAQAGARRSIATQPGQLPANAQAARQQAQAKQQAKQAQAQAHEQQVQQAAVPARQVEVTTFQPGNEPKPNMPPAQEVLLPEKPATATKPVSQPQQQASFDGLPEQEAELPDGFAGIESSVERLEAMIRAEHEPVEEVASYLFEAAKTHEMLVALAEVDNDPSALLAKRLGYPWCLAHKDYLERLVEAVQSIGESNGMLEEEPADDDSVGAES